MFRGVLERHVRVDQIKNIDMGFGTALIELTEGRSVRAPFALASDSHRAKRALVRLAEQVATKPPR